jgi:hypothetical protein
MKKMAIAAVMLLVTGLAVSNLGFAQSSTQQSAADQAQQSANQAQSAADQAQQNANQAQGAASNAANQTNQSVGGGSKKQDQTGTAAQGQTSGTTSISDTSANAPAHGGKLPQSASPLPLLGLLGLGTVGFGVWKVRFRRK